MRAGCAAVGVAFLGLAASKRASRRIAVVTGVIFVIAGLPKFVAFRWEVDNFLRFGLPAPAVWVGAASVLLAMTMAVAIGVSGIRNGDVLPSLTLAPALLIACIYLAVEATPRAK